MRRAMSGFPRVTSVTGGPRELSMPWALWEAGGRLAPGGERGSWPGAAAGCGEKYEGVVADEAAEVVAAGVEGSVSVARRRRGESEVEVEAAVELAEGRRNRVGGSGAVLVLALALVLLAVVVRWSEWDGRRERWCCCCCCEAPDEFREWVGGMAGSWQLAVGCRFVGALAHTRQGSAP